MLRTLVYRPDIDGLRALAVLLVLGFHVFPEHFPGGFLGVDVFFVISGFVITSLTLEELRLGRFSFFGFYGRRIRRIFPALLLVLSASLLLGWRYYFPSEFTLLGSHVFAAATFWPNIQFFRDSGYFDFVAWRKPLLHLWSLGVEEQFYLLWPFLLLFARLGRAVFAALLGLACVASLAWLLAQGNALPGGAFFLPQFRVWEIGLGCFLACVSPWHGPSSWKFGAHWLGNAFSAAGLALVAFGVLRAKGGDRLSLAEMAAVVAGALLLLQTGRSSFFGCRLFSHPWAVFLGKISYPLYLWHWPLLSFARTVAGPDYSEAHAYWAAGISFPLAALTALWVERPARAGRWSPAFLLAGMLAAAGLGWLAQERKILPDSRKYPIVTHLMEQLNPEYAPANVELPKGSDLVLFVGDSNAIQYWSRINYLVNESGRAKRGATFVTGGGCAPIPVPPTSEIGGCAEVFAEALRKARDPKVKTVVVAAAWTQAFAHHSMNYMKVGDGQKPAPELEIVERAMREYFDALSGKGKRKLVVVLNITMSMSLDPFHALRRRWLGPWEMHAEGIPRAQWELDNGPPMRWLRSIAEKAGAEVVDPTESLCDDKVCFFADEDGVPTHKDGVHLAAPYVRKGVRYLDKYFVE